MTPDASNFPDPYDYVVGANRLTIEFYGYQGRIEFADLDACVGGANRDVRQKFGAGQADTLMGTTPYVWSTDKVELLLSPGERLTWRMWSTVPVVSETFVCENGYRGTQFILYWHGIGPVGYGQLLARSAEQSSTTINAFPDPYDKAIQ